MYLMIYQFFIAASRFTSFFPSSYIFTENAVHSSTRKRGMGFSYLHKAVEWGSPLDLDIVETKLAKKCTTLQSFVEQITLLVHELSVYVKSRYWGCSDL